ncbi:low affinity immunoglobulin gamma Fc region receptor II-a-like isoform X1 [Esox lucius]|uniref:low affinity immunoglobulin gamma Fc region receptor II-a-like isoform X1 n=1 Tax=Esox lucius TaxID=8010 RepID=UPI0010BD299B|nr:low affinity immunoglobulin gamma Fc region receptor II-a-like isoform X1 [Esox lucius]
MELTPLYWILLMFSSGLTAGDASLHISPDSSQVFEYDSLTVSCDVGWVVKRFTLKEETTECGNTWGKRNILDCIISSLRTRDIGQYWCESGSGERSSTVNITVHDGCVILESPALPVTEGHSVSLNCRYKKTPSNLTADFYKDGSLIRNESTGVMTIPAVSQSDEGLYSCRHPELGESPESRMTVTDNRTPSALFIPLSAAGLFISLISLLVGFCYCKRNRDVASEFRDEMYCEVMKPDQVSKKRRESPGSDTLYSTVQRPSGQRM